MTRDLTKGPILGGILRLFGPLLASKLLQQCYNVADGVIVGRLLGVSAFSAVGCTGAVNFMVLGFAIGSCSGFSIPIAQSFGAKNGEEVKKNAAQLIWLGLLLTAFLMLLALLFTDDVLRLMRTPPEIFDEAYRYIIVILMGTGATILYNLTSFVLRALGDTRTPLFFLTASVTLNIVLDVLFIRFLSLGVSGAAIATVISQLSSGVACLVYIRKRVPILHISAAHLRPDWRRIGHIAGLGVPMGAQFSITAIGVMAVQSAVNHLGADAVAAVYAANKINDFVLAPIECFGLSTATFCGQNMGAKRLDRIRRGIRSMACVAFAYCVAAFTFNFFTSNSVATLFLDPAETQIFAMMRRFLLTNSAAYPCIALIYLLRNSLQSMGFSRQAMLTGAAELTGQLLVGFGLVHTLGFTAICLAAPSAWILADAFLITLYSLKMKECEKRFGGEETDRIEGTL